MGSNLKVKWTVGSAILAEDLGSIPNSYMVGHYMTAVPGNPAPSSDLSRHQARMWYT